MITWKICNQAVYWVDIMHTRNYHANAQVNADNYTQRDWILT